MTVGAIADRLVAGSLGEQKVTALLQPGVDMG